TNPRGVYYATNIVVSFHEVLVTKSDKSFRARCFFPELTQPLDQSLEVMTKAPQEFLTYSKSPACVYSMHNATFKVVEEGRSIGPALGSAQIGDLILHKWSCPDLKMDTITLLFFPPAYSWFFQPFSAFLSTTVWFPTEITKIIPSSTKEDLNNAYAESYVFKFAEKPTIFFNCRIQQCPVRNGGCTELSPPYCEGTKNNQYTKTNSQYLPLRKGNNVINSAANNVQSFSNIHSIAGNFASKEKNWPMKNDSLPVEILDENVKKILTNRLRDNYENSLASNQKRTSRSSYRNVLGSLIVLNDNNFPSSNISDTDDDDNKEDDQLMRDDNSIDGGKMFWINNNDSNSECTEDVRTVIQTFESTAG
uniref:ZP domain-containing protein n=1 Tax=Romanomermis culicivorax TaxID=13658 RepID=A0A915IV76_ROMCU